MDSDSETGSDSSIDTGSKIEPDGGVDDQCVDRGDFAFCSSNAVDRYGIDLAYDICIDEVCVTPGACDAASCNIRGQHFPVPPASGSARLTRTETVTGEAVVTDSVTGLFWQGNVPTGFDGCTAGPIDGVRDIECMWWQAFDYCDALDYGGYTDWYLPDEHELLSIIDFDLTQPSVDPAVFPGTPSDIFWTSSAFDDEYAWLVSTDMGRVDYWYKDIGALVRCVRREPAEISNRFARTEPSPGEPVVSDAATGLVWQGCAAGQIGDETECAGVEIRLPEGTATGCAATYCSDLDWGSYSDWRLPDIKALSSLVDLRRTGTTAFDETAFPSIPTDWLWSSTQYAPYPGHAWFVDAADGHANVTDENYGHAVLCMRYSSQGT